ncbi:hypothetical protein ATV_gp69 [Bicaudavirus pozzuoliense]|uniref:Uncharacterized protein ORF192 n=2 Tax=Acidianus two-tailed virus TaxID=315953 RepID=Y192_ATV|nr:hypothetical protein ATV_gp69 [Acidianus two-tailed virus]Q3V4T8.1 RecName: Full=Uncharacterized protein ORF192 [Acidianus two-tailed virus]AON96545.1 hypothetical protein [Acidianus two-tailed phage variant 1]CAI59876.1 hypothetical protein [Acidianus two-tailed virus]
MVRIIAMGQSPLCNFIKEQLKMNIIVYPEFFDNKKLLLQRRVRDYIISLLRNYRKIRYALYPDYYYRDINLPAEITEKITFIYPVHSKNEVEFIAKLKSKYNIIPGFASDSRYRDYDIYWFVNTFREEKWYLGISTWRELREAKRFEFYGGDITGFVLGNHEDRKNPEVLRRKLKEIIEYVSRPQGKQLTLF